MKRWGEVFKRLLGFGLPAATALSSLWPVEDVHAFPGQEAANALGSRRLEPVTFTIPNRLEGPDIFIRHRSHSSHQSHRSHYSSRGGGAGSHTAPQRYSPPVYSPPRYLPPYSPPPSTPSPSTNRPPVPLSSEGRAPYTAPERHGAPADTPSSPPMSAPSPSITRPPVPRYPADRAPQGEAIFMTIRVQVELFTRGYYNGPLDGNFGPQTKKALMQFQMDQGMTVSGVMDNATLARLGITG